MKKNTNLLNFILIFIAIVYISNPVKIFAKDSITSNEITPNTFEVKASSTITVNTIPSNGDLIQVGDCVVAFASSTSASDLDCVGGATINFNSVGSSTSDIATAIGSIINASSTLHGNLSLTVGTGGASTSVVVQTLDTEISSSSIEVVPLAGKIVVSNTIDGVIPVAQVVEFVPTGAEGDGSSHGVISEVTVNIDGIDYTFETAGDGVESEVVSGLDELLQADPNVNCSDDGAVITCIAKNPGTAFTYGTKAEFLQSWSSSIGSGSSGVSQQIDLASINKGGNTSTTTLDKLITQNISATTSSFVFSRKLIQGMQGDDVKELQKRLNSEEVYTGPITGLFGPLTKQGVKDFQKKYNINQLGIVGPATLEKLNSISKINTIDTEKSSQAEKSSIISMLQKQLDLLLVKFMALVSQDYPDAILINQPLPSDLKDYGKEDTEGTTTIETKLN